LYKNFKRHKITDHSEMFRIVCDPSSGSIKLYLPEIRNGSLMFVVCLIGVWQRNYDGLPARRTVHTHHLFKYYVSWAHYSALSSCPDSTQPQPPRPG